MQYAGASNQPLNQKMEVNTMSKKILGEKHVVVAVVEVNNSNPNGDKEDRKRGV